jgi:uncharacterized protein
MDQTIEKFIQKQRIAVVGISRNANKFGNAIFKELAQRGYEVYPVHPSLESVQGKPCVKDLTALQGRVEGLVVCISKDRVPEVLRQAEAVGIRDIWLQQGAESSVALQTAAELGLSLVTGKCILMYAQPVTSFHKFHRFFARIFGQY